MKKESSAHQLPFMGARERTKQVLKRIFKLFAHRCLHSNTSSNSRNDWRKRIPACAKNFSRETFAKSAVGTERHPVPAAGTTTEEQPWLVIPVTHGYLELGLDQ